MRFVFFVWLMLIALSPNLAVAEPPDSGLDRFKNELVNAYRHPDAERIRKLMHPKSLACLQAEPSYERYLLKSETIQAIPGDAKISIETISLSDPLPYRDFTFPLRPTHVVKMEFGKKGLADGRSSTTQIADKYIASAADRWYLILPCPTPEGMGRLREMGLVD